MIEYLSKPFSDEESLSSLNPYVRKWFEDSFSELTPPQKFTFKLIGEGKNVLVTAPTGSGKTISGFLSIISKLFDKSLAGDLEDKIYCIYVSPLRALNNDIYRNLTKPLEDIYGRIIKEKGAGIIKGNMKKVTIGVRTGDTTQQERRKQLLKAPNILVTTPESLAIIINSRKFMENMDKLEYIIVDEIHELANNKRGVHLSLTLERLTELIHRKPVRIGLGATLYPIEEAAKFLVGVENGKPRDCKVVDASWSKKLDVVSKSPVKDLIYTDSDEIEDALYKELDKAIKKYKTTLIFTNTRSGTERVVFNLKKRFNYGEDIAAHHSSLSRESRMEVEDMLKKGALKCAVTSTSLELGVDIGTIEDVIQLGSPKSVTRAIQRIGRAGHSFKEVAKGEIISMDRDDVVECTVMLDAAMKRHLDSFSVPENALDVLAQHIVGMSLNRKWNVDDAYAVVKGAYPYATLEKTDFMALINYLAGNYVSLESRRVYGKIWYDEKDGMFGRRGKMAQVIYMLNLGTIPDEVAINVLTTSKKWVGNIEEEFLTKLKPGDIFTLGGRLYRFEYARSMKCYVTEAKTSAPTIPPWFSEQLPLSYELAIEIGKFRAEFSSILKKGKSSAIISKISEMPRPAYEFLSKLPMDDNARVATYNYFVEQILFAKAVPTDKLILVEKTHDPDTDKQYIIFHSLFGRRVNDTFSRAIAISLGERYDTDIGIMVNDNGFLMTSSEEVNISLKALEEAIGGVIKSDVTTELKLNIRRTEMMRRRFRHVAARSFMILRNYKGWKISVGKQQINSQLLLKAVEEVDPNFPVLKETYREILNDVMDLPRTVQLLKKMEKGEVKYKMIDTDVPSPFSHKTLTFGHADVIMMKSKRMYLQKLHASVLERLGMPVKKIAKQKGKDKGTRPRKQPKTNRKRR